MSPRGISRSVFVLLPALSALSCSASQKASESGPDLSTSTVAVIPETAHRTLLDFGSKIQLVAYELSPESGGPGDSLTLKLYWRPMSRFAPGWSFFTHLEDDRGRQLWNYDRDGAFRAALAGGAGLSALTPGKTYVDEQTIQLPKPDQLAPRVGIVVGVWQGDMRLPVVSGPTNGHEAGVVQRFSTGLPRVVPQKDVNPRPQG